MTLFIGLYDYAYGTNAYEYDNNQLKEINLSSKQYDVVCYHTHLNEKEQKIYNDLLFKYNRVILCKDGRFEILK